MAQTFKSPLAQAEAISKVPPYNKEVLLDFLTQYGDFMTDEGYEAWAQEKGKKLGPRGRDALGETRFGDYSNDDEWLQEAWEYLHPDALEYSEHLKQNPNELKSLRDARKIRGWHEGQPTIDFKEGK